MRSHLGDKVPLRSIDYVISVLLRERVCVHALILLAKAKLINGGV